MNPLEKINRVIRNDEGNQLSPEKQELLALEADGKYLFSGTDVDVTILEPRQAMDTKAGPDGEPAVFASNRAEMAIFSAIMRGSNIIGGSSNTHFGTNTTTHDNGTITHTPDFGMHRDTAENLKESATGWVYVFNRHQFAPHLKEQEFVSYVPVTPLRKIKVAKCDLPADIEIFE